MQIIIDIPDGDYKFIKDLQFYNSGRRCGRTIEQNVILGIRNGIPYEPKGDLISREALKEVINDLFRTGEYDCNSVLNAIDNAPVVGPKQGASGYQLV